MAILPLIIAARSRFIRHASAETKGRFELPNHKVKSQHNRKQVLIIANLTSAELKKPTSSNRQSQASPTHTQTIPWDAASSNQARNDCSSPSSYPM